MIFEAEIRDLASDGRGITSTPEGMTCFVAGVWPGEYGRFRLVGKSGKIAQAELVELIQASEHRREAPCAYHGFSDSLCGGCAWQFMSYDAQLEAKQKRVQKALARIQQDVAIQPVQASPREFAYRNRAQFKTDGERLGFQAARSNALVDIATCPVLSERNQRSLQALRAYLPNKQWRASNKKQRKGRAKPAWVTLDIDEDNPAEQASVNQRLSFQQGNSEQNRFMQSWLAEQTARLDPACEVLELFSGAGNFTRILSQQGLTKIVAAEIDERAVAELEQKQLPGVRALACNLYEENPLTSLLKQTCECELLLLDPPRDGFKDIGKVCEKMRKLKDVIYISCDLATFCRDAQNLVDIGFKMITVQPLDLFPQTPHVEILSRFSHV